MVPDGNPRPTSLGKTVEIRLGQKSDIQLLELELVETFNRPTRKNASLDLVGFITPRFQLAGPVLEHDFALGRDLPVEVILGVDLLQLH